ncbi:uncharacterized protein LOC144886531 [Branchiostoma floridae x Branchiostoma japonicum]
MSRRRGRRRHRRSRKVPFPSYVPSGTNAGKNAYDGRQRYLKIAAVSAMLLFAVTAVAAVTMTAHFNTDVEVTATNLPRYRRWGDNRADDPDGLSGQSGWESVRVKRDFAVDDSRHYGVPDSMTSTDAPPLFDPKSTTPLTGDMKNAKVPDQTETLKSDGWKSFRVEEFPTGDVDSHTQVQTIRPQLSDEEWNGYEGWGFTAEDTSVTGIIRS